MKDPLDDFLLKCFDPDANFNPKKALYLVRNLCGEGKKALVERMITEFLGRYPNMVDIISFCCDIQEDLGNFGDAIVLAKRIAAIDSSRNISAILERLGRKRRYAELWGEITPFTGIVPCDWQKTHKLTDQEVAEMLYLQGEEHRHNGSLADAIPYYELTLRYDPFHCSAARYAVDYYLAYGDPQNALPIIDVILSRYTDKIGFYIAKAGACHALGRQADSVAVIRCAIEFNPTRTILYRLLFDMLITSEKFEEAQKIGYAAFSNCQIDQNVQDIAYNLAILALKNRDYRMAQENFSRLLVPPGPLMNLGKAGLAAVAIYGNDFVEARRRFQDILDHDSKNALGLAGLAVINLFENPRNGSAKSTFWTCLRKVKENKSSKSSDMIVLLGIIAGIIDDRSTQNNLHRRGRAPYPSAKEMNADQPSPLVLPIRSRQDSDIHGFAEMMVGQRMNRIWRVIGSLTPVDRTTYDVSGYRNWQKGKGKQ